MKVYNYHPLSGVVLGEGVADENPLQPDSPIVPGYSTPKAPPVASGEIAAYRTSSNMVPQNWPDGDWVLVEDNTSTPLFSTSDGRPFAFDDRYNGLGPVPAWLTASERPSPAHVWKDGAWQRDDDVAAALSIEVNKREKGERESRARAAMEPLQMSVDVEMATDDEKAALIAWKRYFVLLSKVDLAAPAWPAEPVV